MASQTRALAPQARAEAQQAQVKLITDVQALLGQREGQIGDLLQGAIPFERFRTVAIHAVNSNPDLFSCTAVSIVEAIREAAALGLEPTGLLGDAYLVKYGDQAKLMPGYRGLLKLARRSGEITGVDAQVVYEGDEFDLELGTNPTIKHRPLIDGERGNYRGAYAWARLATGELQIEWLTYADIEAVRKTSRAAQSGPWVTFWAEMARKTALRRLMKRLPLGAQAERAIELDAEAEGGPDHPASRTETPERVARIQARVGMMQPLAKGAGARDEAGPGVGAGSDGTQPPEMAPLPAEPAVEGEVGGADWVGRPASPRPPDDEIPPDVQAGLDLLR